MIIPWAHIAPAKGTRAVNRVDPWIIEQLEEEERRRQDEEARRHRIELPQTAPAGTHDEERERTGTTSRVHIVPISPPSNRISENVIDV